VILALLTFYLGTMRITVASGLSLAFANSATNNPFADTTWYVNPTNMVEYDSSIATATGTTKVNLEGMKHVPSAYWIDVKDKIDDTSLRGMRGIMADAAAKSPPELVVFMHYDVPNRDCKAVASNGEICCSYKSDGRCDYTAGGDCSTGLQEYRTTYVDPFVRAINAFPTVPVVVVVEPDSLPNLATNLDNPKCGNTATKNAYRQGIKYAIEQLSTTHATLYIDGAHGGWLGWDDNLQAFIKELGPAGMNVDLSNVRGFAQNVANYQAIGTMCPWEPDQGSRNSYCLQSGQSHSGAECCDDPCGLASQWNPAVNEMNFAQSLTKASESILNWSPVNIIDTGRNGVVDARKDCANWCNPRGMGAGSVPTTNSGSDLVDALFWLKTPGESDGCTQTTPDGNQCARYDTMCGSSDSIGSQSSEPHAPEAGKWFDFQVKMLAANAVDTNWPVPGPPTPPVPSPVPVPTPSPVPVPTPSPVPVPKPSPVPVPKPSPVPVPKPSPVPVPTPVPPPASGGKCCWGGWPASCDTATDCHDDAYCDSGADACTGGCSGAWCEHTSSVAV